MAPTLKRVIRAYVPELRRRIWTKLGSSKANRWIPFFRFLHVSDDAAPFAVRSYRAFPASPGVAVANRNVFEAPLRTLESISKPLFVHRFDNASVVHNQRFDSVICQDRLILPPRRERGPWALYKGRKPQRVGLITGQHVNIVALQRKSPFVEIPVALFIGMRAPYNWYHWIANVLPALYVANQIPETDGVPLLLSERVRTVPQMIEALGIFLCERPVIWVPPEELVHVKRLYWAQSPVEDEPFSIDRAERLPLQLHRNSMEGYRDALLEYGQQNKEVRDFPSKLFLGRKDNYARPHNAEEVQEWAANSGFSSLALEELTLSAQIAVFSQASHAIGPTGAAFTNLLFASKGLRALRIHGGARHYENYFPNLAALAGAQVFDFPCGNSLLAGEGRSFYVQKGEFEKAVARLLQ